MFKTLYAWKRLVFWGFTIVFWGMFIAIWTRWGDAQLFTSNWWFDLLGHALAGMVLAYNIFFYFRNYRSPYRSFRLIPLKFQGEQVLAMVTKAAFAWEVMEGVIDLSRIYFKTGMFPAQSHALDSTADFFVCYIMAVPSIYCYRKIVRWLERELPTEHLDEQIREWEALGEELGRELTELAQNPQHKRIIRKRFKQGMDRVLHTIGQHGRKHRRA